MTKKTRFFTGELVASTNTLKNIMGKRLQVQVRFTSSGRVISKETVGIRQEFSSGSLIGISGK